MLKRLCDKFEIDYQEIDDTLTYWENKAHLCSLAYWSRYYPLDPAAPGLAKWESHWERYMSKHVLSWYVLAIEDGETVSEEVGEVLWWYPRFSLSLYIQYVGRTIGFLG